MNTVWVVGEGFGGGSTSLYFMISRRNMEIPVFCVCRVGVEWQCGLHKTHLSSKIWPDCDRKQRHRINILLRDVAMEPANKTTKQQSNLRLPGWFETTFVVAAETL